MEQSLRAMEVLDPEIIVKELAINDYLSIEDGAGDIRKKKEVGYYCWLPGFIQLVKPKQIIELGSAMGVAVISMLSSSYKDFELYGVTLEEKGLEFCYVEEGKYPNFHPIIGDYMDMSIWPKNVDLSKTDIWFVDGLHEETHLRAELDLYKQFFKEGAYVLFDDMLISPGMGRVYQDLKTIFPIRDQFSSTQLHWTEFVICLCGGKFGNPS